MKTKIVLVSGIIIELNIRESDTKRLELMIKNRYTDLDQGDYFITDDSNNILRFDHLFISVKDVVCITRESI